MTLPKRIFHSGNPDTRTCHTFAARLLWLAVVLPVMVGCGISSRPAMLPSEREVVRDQLIFHSDFHLPKKHRILNELTARRAEISERLSIPVSDEPIHVYLFEDAEAFRDYMKRNHPAFPDRRAFFVKSDTKLMVYAYWGDRVAEDLRHEVTHGYLHSVVPNIPIWLDEGIAEYFETPTEAEGRNDPHIRLLADAFRYKLDQWQPNLARLEQLEYANDLTQLDYAESWLWVHFLLHQDAQTNSLVCNYLEACRVDGRAGSLSGSLSEQVSAYMPDVKQRLIVHLKNLADAE